MARHEYDFTPFCAVEIKRDPGCCLNCGARRAGPLGVCYGCEPKCPTCHGLLILHDRELRKKCGLDSGDDHDA